MVVDSDMANNGGSGAAFTYHGGNLAAARAVFPDAPEPWVDLSTGINGRPYPVGSLDPALLDRLPEPAGIAALEAVAARAYGCAPSAVVAAPGTGAVIAWLPYLVPARRVGVLGFTYAEHASAWRQAGADVRCVRETEDLAGFDAAVVVNPNNPDGRRLAPEALLAIVARNGFAVVDEAFVDMMAAGSSLAPLLPPARTVILRSFGKPYGLAGLRLGFALGTPDMAAILRAALGPWAVSALAATIGTRALADHAWLAAATARLEADALRLDALLTGAGATILGGTPLFRLARFTDAAEMFARLARAGILVRPFAEHADWLRFGIPACGEHWRRLAVAMAGPAPGDPE